VNPAKIVEGEVERERGPMVLKLAAQAVRQARESANLHPRGEVLTLDVRGGRPVLRKVWNRFQGQIGIGDEVSECHEGSAVRWLASIIADGKR